MANVKLTVEPRATLGKKVKALRRRGLVPANVYGHRVESVAVQAQAVDVQRLLRETGRNAIIDLTVGAEKAIRPVMIRSTQRDPVSHELLHVDFYQISLKERMRADVPVHLTGVSPAVKDFHGILLHELETIAVRALPTDIPAAIEVDVSGLAELDQSIHVRDLPQDPMYEVLTDGDVVIAKVAAPRLVAEEEAPAAAEEVPAPAEPERVGRPAEEEKTEE